MSHIFIHCNNFTSYIHILWTFNLKICNKSYLTDFWKSKQNHFDIKLQNGLCPLVHYLPYLQLHVLYIYNMHKKQQIILHIPLTSQKTLRKNFIPPPFTAFKLILVERNVIFSFWNKGRVILFKSKPDKLRQDNYYKCIGFPTNNTFRKYLKNVKF